MTERWVSQLCAGALHRQWGCKPDIDCCFPAGVVQLCNTSTTLSLFFASVQLFCCRAVRLCIYYSVSFPAAFLTQTVCLDDTTVKFEIWDTAGQERYHSLAPMYYRGAQAAIVVYDITNTVSHMTSAKALRSRMSPGQSPSLNLGWFLVIGDFACQLFICILSKWYVFQSAFSVFKDTFTRAKNWVKELQRQASPNIVIALAGNKADLANKRAVDHQVRRSSNGPTGKPSFPQTSTPLFFFYYFISPGSTSICRWQQLALYGNFSQDCNERQRDLHGHRWAALSCIQIKYRNDQIYGVVMPFIILKRFLHDNWDVLLRNEEIPQIPPLAICFFLLKHGVFSSAIRLCFERVTSVTVEHEKPLMRRRPPPPTPRRPSGIEISELFSVDSQEAA